VTIVTGFLGAGKTTLVKHFLETAEGHGTAVVVNEFGQAGIDDALLRDSTEQIALIGNGCLCCNVRSDLEATLHRLLADGARGLIPQVQRIVIETSGLADPSPILTTFASERALGGEFHVEAVIAVMAAAAGPETLARFAEARRQVMLADRIIVTKTDIADDNALAAVTAHLRRLNPRAEIGSAVHGALDPKWFTEAPGTYAANAGGFLADRADHTDDVRSFVLTPTAPVEWEVFARTMEALTALRGADLLRVKGILDVAGCQGPVVVQFVQHLAHPPVELERWPPGEHASRIVFITRGIEEQAVKALFAAVAAVASTGA